MDFDVVLEALSRHTIIEIPDETRFWMVRTKKGYFYDEFVKSGFVALGWNVIHESTDMGQQSIDTLKEHLKHRYGETRPMGPINKCKNFMFEIKNGDILLIPNNGSSLITLAKAGDYYENTRLSVEEELETIARIEDREIQINDVLCPYRKRRNIDVLCTVDANRLGYRLRRAISSYHGISCFDEYAEDILCNIYNGFAFKGNALFSINVSKQTPIKPREVSGLMYSVTEFFCELVDEDSLSTTINLNSPGKITVKLQDGFKYLTKQKVPLIGMFLLITGGSAFGFEFPGIVGFIKEAKTMEIQIESEKVELQGKELDNALKAIELVKQAEEAGVNIDNVCDNLGLLNTLGVSLQFQSNQEFEMATLSDAASTDEE